MSDPFDEEDLPEPAGPAKQTALEIAIDRVRYQSIDDALTDEQARMEALVDDGACPIDPCKDSPYLAELDASANSAQRRAAREARRWRPIVLAAVRKCPNVGFAAQVAVINVSTIARHCDNDPVFGTVFKEAFEEGKQLELAVAWQHGFEGVVRAKYHMGIVVGYERVSSDKMREMFLRAHFPDMFDRPHRSQISVAGRTDEPDAFSIDQIHEIVSRSPLFLKQSKPDTANE